MESAAIAPYIAISAVLFAVGVAGVLTRRSPLVILMCVEIMWNAANVVFIAFARQFGHMDGHIFAFFVITVAAAEVAIALGLIVLIFRRRDRVDADDLNLLKG